VPGWPFLLVPRIATTWTAGSSRQASKAAVSSRIMGSDSALSALGRFSVISPALPRRSSSTSALVSVFVFISLMPAASIQPVH
jgi:hypothetical protein